LRETERDRAILGAVAVSSEANYNARSHYALSSLTARLMDT